jgi:hypothetical protein
MEVNSENMMKDVVENTLSSSEDESPLIASNETQSYIVESIKELLVKEKRGRQGCELYVLVRGVGETEYSEEAIEGFITRIEEGNCHTAIREIEEKMAQYLTTAVWPDLLINTPDSVELGNMKQATLAERLDRIIDIAHKKTVSNLLRIRDRPKESGDPSIEEVMWDHYKDERLL